MLNVQPCADPPQTAHRKLETLAVSVAAFLAAMLLVELVPVLDRTSTWLAVGCALLVSHWVSDLVSGLVHWAFDNIFDETTPLLGPNFVRPFREHHGDPTGITRHDFIELNGNTCLAVAPVLAIALVAFDPLGANSSVTHGSADGATYATFAATASTFGVAFTAFFAMWTVLTNQFHKWSHQLHPPPLARLLQRCHIVLSRDHHAGHHHPPFDTRYCITSGAMNRWIDRSGVLRSAESWILSQRQRTK
jgi:hypothetical protein